MSKKPADAKGRSKAAETSSGEGPERRKADDRRNLSRRLDERRAAGIGEIMDDRREQRGRRHDDRRGQRPARRGTES